jgi:hypothetical protein
MQPEPNENRPPREAVRGAGRRTTNDTTSKVPFRGRHVRRDRRREDPTGDAAVSRVSRRRKGRQRNEAARCSFCDAAARPPRGRAALPGNGLHERACPAGEVSL